MKRRRIIQRALLLLGAVIVLVCISLNQSGVRPDSPAPVLQPPGTELPQIRDFDPEILSLQKKPPDEVPAPKPRYSEPVPKQSVPLNRNQDLSEQFMIRALPALFNSQEGSASDAAELFGGGGPRNVELNSEWLIKHLISSQALPSLRLRVLQDPFTGEYRISGGAVALPGSGLEAGYETETDSDGYKATLQWKKSF
ncbi:MAG: hypothetical protein MUC65_04775 [Pontiellaceae bacterium]|jgi:hypothetical protein|nr:hypothetical protein [Pontiellaceae bacterium]